MIRAVRHISHRRAGAIGRATDVDDAHRGRGRFAARGGLALMALVLGLGSFVGLPAAAAIDAGPVLRGDGGSAQPLNEVLRNKASTGSGRRALGSALPQLPPAPPSKSRRTISVDTVSELKRALSHLRGGDRIVVEAGTYPTQHTIKRKRLTSPAHIVFKPGAYLTGGPRSTGNYVGFAVTESSNIWIRGGNFSDPEGDAIKINSSTNIVFNGAVAHDSGDSCIMVAATSEDNHAIWLINVETYGCGNSSGDLATSDSYPDGYWRKGTHGIYYGSSWNGYKTYGGGIVNLYGHDQPNGSILQIGDGARGLVVTGATLVRAVGDPTVFAGNALNFWGEYNENVTWVNMLVYRANNHVLQATTSTEGAGSAIRSLMHGAIGRSLFLQSSNGAPAIGQTWNADPLLGPGGVPSAVSPAVGKADLDYLWPTDRTGRARTARTLGAFEVRPVR